MRDDGCPQHALQERSILFPHRSQLKMGWSNLFIISIFNLLPILQINLFEILLAHAIVTTACLVVNWNI